MKRDLTLVHQAQFGVLRVFLLFIMAAGLSGCLPSMLAQDLSKASICATDSTVVNIYRTAPQTWANTIFEYAYPTMPTPVPPNIAPPIQLNEGQILSARYAAFKYLVDETKRWSDVETLQFNDLSEAQVIVTFISPEILQSIFLSESLKNRFITSDFQTRNQSMLDTIAGRNELLFLLTVTTNNANLPHHIIKIPIHKLFQNTSEDLQIEPTHDDHNLEQPINTMSESVFGYFAYPLARLVGYQCELILDPKYNTNIVISVESIEIDGVNTGPYSWTIPYKPLMNPIAPPALPDFIIPQNFDQTLMSPLPKPPIGIDQNNNWQDFARFLWSQITQGNY